MSRADEPDEVLQQSLRLLEPVVRLLLRNGIDHPRFAAALKRVFVDVALDELARPTPPSKTAPTPATHTAVSLRTGLQRRDVKALRYGASARFPAKALSPTLPMQVVARWTTDPAYLDHDGNPRPLPLRDADKSAVSFEILTDGLSKDIHAPALRDELVRLGLARDDDGLISLLAAGFAPARDSVQLLGAMARNGHDHLAAAVANVLEGKPHFLEYSLVADGLRPASTQLLHDQARKLWATAYRQSVQSATELVEADKALGFDASAPEMRVRFGVYFYSEPVRREGTDS